MEHGATIVGNCRRGCAMARSAPDPAVGVAIRESMTSPIDPINICPRCHGGGFEPTLAHTGGTSLTRGG